VQSLNFLKVRLADVEARRIRWGTALPVYQSVAVFSDMDVFWTLAVHVVDNVLRLSVKDVEVTYGALGLQ
jgi:hypothetical protein